MLSGLLPLSPIVKNIQLYLDFKRQNLNHFPLPPIVLKVVLDDDLNTPWPVVHLENPFSMQKTKINDENGTNTWASHLLHPFSLLS